MAKVKEEMGLGGQTEHSGKSCSALGVVGTRHIVPATAVPDGQAGS